MTDMPSKKDKFSDCYKLDHGGIIYPYIAKADWNQVFRLEAELDELYEALSARYADLISRAAAGEDADALAEETWALLCSICR